MNKLFLWTAIVALAGFLFGFDTIVISGADQKLQTLWQTSDLFHGSVVMSMALWGTVLGAIFGGIPTNSLGRKNTLIGIGVLYFISAVGSALANDAFVFAFFRFLGGLGVGASTIAAPAYITEIAPSEKRGRLVAMYQLSIVIGILAAFLSNYLVRNIGENAWRWMMGMEAFPALLYAVAVNFVPKSPRWLIQKGRIEEARKTLTVTHPEVDVDRFIDEISGSTTDKSQLFTKANNRLVWLVFFIAFFNQFSGINALLYYSPRIFEEAGLGTSTAFLSSVGIGVVNVIFTLLGMALIDKMGRKPLMYIGSVGYIISLSMVALSFFMNWGGLAVPIFLFLFIGAHAVGQGAVIWVFLAELFPTGLRASGQAFGSSVHWVLAAVIPSLIPYAFSAFSPAVVFLFFAIMMVGQLYWVNRYMPETKGKPAE
jgi:sugar porter (SP) family MFS transporter